ncbi:glutaredoxin, partial [Coemansia sp. S142-1]
GTAAQPRCGFSKKIVGMLNEQNIKYGYFDILTDEQVRQGLKEYSDWPTYPQLYISGELVGGVDIVAEMIESGDLIGMVPAEAVAK